MVQLLDYVQTQIMLLMHGLVLLDTLEEQLEEQLNYPLTLTGVTLFGDKTAQTKPSAFDRINVRRLFLVLEKAIATAAKFQLFEFNDEFTRAQFRSLIEPFLRDVQGRRGITDFIVKCDNSNNTGSVIDRNEFVADIFVKPARSINFITLNFIATRTGVAFSEVGG
jgi:phage tail sheath protein FI